MTLKLTLQETVTKFETSTLLVKRTTPQGNISYHLITLIKDQWGNEIPLTTAYANVAKLEAIEYAKDYDLTTLKYQSKKGVKHD
jgi:hypothetical protein